MEDDQTINEMRMVREKETLRPSFMSPGELLSIRTQVLRVPQGRVIEQLINPSTGSPCTVAAYCRWEKGHRPIPLWVARKMRDLEEAARKYDAKRTS
jgi:hypothetical protein